ncbi:hypothetical protein SeMB42_g04491 [Synchytrium endobioticum]|uniref:DUF427 domain-containing protein n=1 Tax=Synchytrium endobioticum TaxID=286115 RepID=A0A507CXT2_9FUNG|nr:hypothetical protein SeMB42_g04491 [Synchytrium endobioticum]TPX48574.1 hypothetical protein SeLEV6574_g01962 [Synchytrium endobioticum]
MPRALFNGVVVAETEKYETVDGNVYFPPDSVKQGYLKDSNTHTSCSWKGDCSYKTVEVNGQKAVDGAWYYPNPKAAASNIKGHYAFWKGVKVEDNGERVRL